MSFQPAPEEILQFEEYYVPASKGKRFINLLIDLIAFYIFFFILGIILAIVYPPIINYLDNEEVGFQILDRIISLLLFVLFIAGQEIIFKGKTFGKFVTKTRAVNIDGTRITNRTAFLRGFSRMVPFEAFSALGDPSNPWHDKWTNT